MSRVCLLCVLIVISVCSALGASIDVVFYDNRFGVLDDSTGAYSPIGTLPVSASGGIAGMNGLLYLEDFGNNLFTVDSLSGVPHLTGNTGLNLSVAAFGGGQDGLFEVDYASNLYSINPLNGTGNLVGATGIAANNGYFDTSLSSNGKSLLYTAGRAGQTDELYRIDEGTGLATDLGNTGVVGVAGSAFVSGKLQLYQYGQNVNYIYSALDGSTSFMQGAQLGAQIIDGGVLVPTESVESSQISATPEPSALWLVISGGVLLALFGVRNRTAKC